MRTRRAQIARFVASVLIVSGVLLLVDVAVTLAWQEPISALIARHEQSQLRHQLTLLERLSGSDERALASIRDQPARFAALAAKAQTRARTGHALGRILLPTLGSSYVVVQGTDGASLRKGPGHYPATPLPGQQGTVAIAGHRTTYLAPFRHINDIQDGDEIRLEMPYAAFTYTVEKHEIVDPGDVQIIKPVGYPRLVLTACHPLYSADKRWAVFAKLTRIDLFALTGAGRWPTP
jgi:sortase A